MNGLSKTEIDNYFTRNNELLRGIAKGICFKSFASYDPDTLITEAYLHTLKHRQQIDTIDKLQRYAIAKIKQEATLSQSETNRMFRISAEVENLTVEQDDTIIDSKIEDELTLNEMRTILALYPLRQRDPIKRIVLEAYTKKGCNSVRKLADYFNISPASSNKLIKEILEELKELRTFEKKKYGTI